MAKLTSSAAIADENVVPLHSGVTDPAKLVVLLGPQNSGKSLLGRAIVERAREQGRDPLICDGDRNDAYLSKVLGQRGEQPGEVIGVRRPSYADDATVTTWFDAEVSDMEEDGRSRLFDMGGGDLVFPVYAKDRELVGMLAEARIPIEPVAIHMILPTVADLTVLEQMETGGLFAPSKTILALNAAPAGDTRPPEVVFRYVRERPAYRAAIARGAREIVVPVLGCMNLQDRDGAMPLHKRAVTFEMMAARTSPLLLAHRQQVATWRRRLYAELDKVAEWLP